MGFFCQDCGNELASQYRFCPSCGGKNLGQGKPFNQQLMPPQTPNNAAQPQFVSPSQPSVQYRGGASYGGFWRRVGAYLVDTVLIMVASFIMGAVGGLLLLSNGGNSNEVLFQVLGLVLGWLYFALMESSESQATIGKRAFGMVVCDTNGNRIRFGQATGRYFGKILSSLILCIGFVMVAFTERKQGLHDLMARTVVLHRLSD